MTFPPENFEKLREALALIKCGDITLDMGKKSLMALNWMIHHADLVAVGNIVSIAEDAQVSPASITRLAKLLGYQGFGPFQLVFKQRSKVASDYYSHKVSQLNSEPPQTIKILMEKQLEATKTNISECARQIDEDSVKSAVKLLAMSQRIFVFGHKQSSAMANVLRYGLCLVRQNVQNLGQYEHGMAIALGQLKKRDLVIIFGYSPYSNLTVELAAMARSLSCQVLVITDSNLSPLNDSATVSINVPTDSDYFTNSLAANFIFIESLLSLVAIELGASAVEKLRVHEDLLTKLDGNA
jgi:DNA-binding MurR/RpiR family transcriptional regulator